MAEITVSAFPVQHQEDANGNVRSWFEPGMTLRDYFAAKALPTVIQQCVTDTRNPGESLEDYFARASYVIADAMLKARQS